MTSLLAYGAFLAAVVLVLAVAFTGRGFLIAREMQIFLHWTRFHRRELYAAAFRFLRQPNRPIPARAVANRGKAAGRGMGATRKTV